MSWSDLSVNPKPKVLRQFAAAWLVFFLVLGALQYWGKGRPQLGLGLAGMALAIGAAGLVWPQAVRWIFVAWMVLAFPFGWVISQMALLVMYYGVLTPVAIVLRLRGRDWLSRKPSPERTTFWTEKQTPRDIRSYFRQY